MTDDWKKNRKNFEKEFEEISEFINRMINSHINSGESKVYGFSMYMGPDGVPHVQNFDTSNIEKTERIREPFVTSLIDEKKNEFNITAEMPGIDKKDLEVDATEDEIIIRTIGERKYYKSIKAPYSIESESAKAKYNNGILEVTFKLKQAKKKKIEIE